MSRAAEMVRKASGSHVVHHDSALLRCTRMFGEDHGRVNHGGDQDIPVCSRIAIAVRRVILRALARI
jgi:hypothetical protein